MANRQKKIVITQQLTSFNYSKRAHSFLSYAFAAETDAKRKSSLASSFTLFQNISVAFFYSSVDVCFRLKPHSLHYCNKLSNGNATTILSNHNIACLPFLLRVTILKMYTLH